MCKRWKRFSMERKCVIQGGRGMQVIDGYKIAPSSAQLGHMIEPKWPHRPGSFGFEVLTVAIGILVIHAPLVHVGCR